MESNKIVLKLVYHTNKPKSSKTMLLIIIAPFTTKEGSILYTIRADIKLKNKYKDYFDIDYVINQKRLIIVLLISNTSSIQKTALPL